MRVALLSFLGLALFAAGCGDDATTEDTQSPAAGATATDTVSPETESSGELSTSPWPSPFSDTAQRWTLRVVERVPHDPNAFTQGLELTEYGLVESTGRRGQSTLRVMDLETGDLIAERRLDDTYFGEGVTLSQGELVQLTWEEGVALRYDPETLSPIGQFTYAGEGWGICASGPALWMSTGTSELTRRDPTTFDVLATVTVRLDGVAIEGLNELECIGDHVVANVWKSNEVLVIDPNSGTVVAIIDAAELVTEIAPSEEQAVLNGITDLDDGTLLLGGKLWPTFFVVEVVAA